MHSLINSAWVDGQPNLFVQAHKDTHHLAEIIQPQCFLFEVTLWNGSGYCIYGSCAKHNKGIGRVEWMPQNMGNPH